MILCVIRHNQWYYAFFLKVYCWELSQPPFPYRNKYMKINFDSAAAVPIINVPAKKVSPQGTPLTREMIDHSLDIPRSTPTQVGLSGNLPPPKKMHSRPYFLWNMAPMALSLAIWPLAMIHSKIWVYFMKLCQLWLHWTNLHEII